MVLRDKIKTYTFTSEGHIDILLFFHQLKTKDFIITTEGVGEILRQIKETAVTKDEYEELKNRITDIETQLSKEKEVTLKVSIVYFWLM